MVNMTKMCHKKAENLLYLEIPKDIYVHLSSPKTDSEFPVPSLFSLHPSIHGENVCTVLAATWVHCICGREVGSH